MTQKKKRENYLATLHEAAHQRSLEVVLPIYRNDLRVEVRKTDGEKKIIDYEKVKDSENAEAAAQRILARMRKSKLL